MTMTEKTSADWRDRAAKIVCSYTPQEAARLKNKILIEHRRQERLKITVLVCCAAYLFCLSAYYLVVYEVSDSANKTFENMAAFDNVSGDISLSSNKSGILLKQNVQPREESKTAIKALPLTAGTRFTVEEELSETVYSLFSGSVRFETGLKDSHKLAVHVGDLVIEDIGTVFTVEILPRHKVHVEVFEGMVMATWPDGNTEIKAGAAGTFPYRETAVFDRIQNQQHSELNAHRSTDDDWRIAARQGRNGRALTLIDRNPSSVLTHMDDLLLAADVMRITGHPSRAAVYLKKAISNFNNDNRRAAAAFALGKVYLNELGQPLEAAKAFRVASENDSPLAEEAEAREAEALFRAGKSEKANAAARRYLDKYPNGARANSVRAFCNDTQ